MKWSRKNQNIHIEFYQHTLGWYVKGEKRLNFLALLMSLFFILEISIEPFSAYAICLHTLRSITVLSLSRNIFCGKCFFYSNLQLFSTVIIIFGNKKNFTNKDQILVQTRAVLLFTREHERIYIYACKSYRRTRTIQYLSIGINRLHIGMGILLYVYLIPDNRHIFS